MVLTMYRMARVAIEMAAWLWMPGKHVRKCAKAWLRLCQLAPETLAGKSYPLLPPAVRAVARCIECWLATA